jgi:hypothetical protein
MTDFRLVREDQDEVFHEIELPYCPRKGERVWVERKHANGATHYILLVKDVMHVVETDDSYAYVELTVREESREEAEPEEEEEEEPTKLSGTVDPEVRERITQAALKELRLNEKKFGQTGMTPKVQM